MYILTGDKHLVLWRIQWMQKVITLPLVSEMAKSDVPLATRGILSAVTSMDASTINVTHQEGGRLLESHFSADMQLTERENATTGHRDIIVRMCSAAKG